MGGLGEEWDLWTLPSPHFLGCCRSQISPSHGCIQVTTRGQWVPSCPPRQPESCRRIVWPGSSCGARRLGGRQTPWGRTPCTPCKRILRDGEGRKLSPKTLESSCDSSPSAAPVFAPKGVRLCKEVTGLAADPAPPPRLPPLNPSLSLGEERGFLPSSPTRAVAVPSLLWVSYTSLRGHFFQDPFLFFYHENIS